MNACINYRQGKKTFTKNFNKKSEICKTKKNSYSTYLFLNYNCFNDSC